jgi:hypothetical protein
MGEDGICKNHIINTIGHFNFMLYSWNPQYNEQFTPAHRANSKPFFVKTITKFGGIKTMILLITNSIY